MKRGPDTSIAQSPEKHCTLVAPRSFPSILLAHTHIRLTHRFPYLATTTTTTTSTNNNNNYNTIRPEFKSGLGGEIASSGIIGNMLRDGNKT